MLAEEALEFAALEEELARLTGSLDHLVEAHSEPRTAVRTQQIGDALRDLGLAA